MAENGNATIRVENSGEPQSHSRGMLELSRG